MKKWLKPLLFAVGGGIAGFLYYRFVGCASGSCPIASSPWLSTAYMAVVGLLLSGLFSRKSCCREE